MRQLKYINSQNEEINFRNFNTQIYQGGFHSYNWTYEGVQQRFGTTINQFGKTALEYEMTVAVRGADKEDNLNDITRITEYDIVNNRQGRLWWGDYYLDCNIISATTAPSEVFFGAERTLGILSPYPFWIKEMKRQFYPEGSGGDEGKFLDYPFDYPFDYSAAVEGIEQWDTGHYAASEFEMTIFGPCENPRILINNYPYEVYDTLETGEYLIIDSRANPVPKVTKYRVNGTTVSLFDDRAKEQSVFNPIPGGNLTVNWNASFGFNLTLYTERSEPAW